MTTLKIADKDSDEASETTKSSGSGIPIKRIVVTLVLLAVATLNAGADGPDAQRWLTELRRRAGSPSSGGRSPVDRRTSGIP